MIIRVKGGEVDEREWDRGEVILSKYMDETEHTPNLSSSGDYVQIM